MRKDVIDIIEAAYRYEEADQTWLDGILDAARSIGPCYAQVLKRDAPDHPAASSALGSHVDGIAERVARVTSIAWANLPQSTLWAHHLPAPPVEHALHREQRIASTFGVHRHWLRRMHRENDSLDMAQYHSVGVLAGDACGKRTMVLGLIDRGPPRGREKALLNRLSAHLTAAIRLRDLTTPDRASAVIDTRGRVLAADESAAPRRTSLVEATKAVERSRGKLRRTSPEEAVELWRAMVAGRWSLVDFIDRDGKRMILARENCPQVRDLQALTPIERSVVGYAALEHSNKHLAYELGLAPSTVASHLARALKKLRLTSRHDLIERFGALAKEEVP